MPLIKMTSSLESEIKKVSLLLPRNNGLVIQAIAFLTSTSSWCLMLLLLVGFLHKQYWSSLLDSEWPLCIWSSYTQSCSQRTSKHATNPKFWCWPDFRQVFPSLKGFKAPGDLFFTSVPQLGALKSTSEVLIRLNFKDKSLNFFLLWCFSIP